MQLHSQWFSDNYLVWSHAWWHTDHSWQWFIMFFYCPVDVISQYYMWNHDSLPAPFEQHVLCVHGKYEHVCQALWCLWKPFFFRRGGHWHERCATPDAELCLSWRREAQSERMQPKEGEGILWPLMMCTLLFVTPPPFLSHFSSSTTGLLLLTKTIIIQLKRSCSCKWSWNKISVFAEVFKLNENCKCCLGKLKH